MDDWMVDPATTCEKAGVAMPNVLSEDNFDDTLSSGVAMVTEEGRGQYVINVIINVCQLILLQ